MSYPEIHTIDLDFKGIKQVIATYLIEGPDGLILVDPGPYSSFSTLEKKIEGLGFTVQDTSDVLVTHVHFDHAGAAWAFAKTGATIHVHPAGKRHLANPDRLWNSAARIYGEQGMSMLWGEMQPIDENLLKNWEHGENGQINGLNVAAHHSPGHAKHHIAWQVEKRLFLGDVGGVKIHGGPVEPPCPPPDIDLEAWKESISLIQAIPAIEAYYLTHFGEVQESIREHWSQLSTTLESWAEFVRTRRTLPTAELTSAFEHMVESQRALNSLPTESYAMANPAMMSASGLLRYWEQKDAIPNE